MLSWGLITDWHSTGSSWMLTKPWRQEGIYFKFSNQGLVGALHSLKNWFQTGAHWMPFNKYKNMYDKATTSVLPFISYRIIKMNMLPSLSNQSTNVFSQSWIFYIVLSKYLNTRTKSLPFNNILNIVLWLYDVVFRFCSPNCKMINTVFILTGSKCIKAPEISNTLH